MANHPHVYLKCQMNLTAALLQPEHISAPPFSATDKGDGSPGE